MSSVAYSFYSVVRLILTGSILFIETQFFVVLLKKIISAQSLCLGVPSVWPSTVFFCYFSICCHISHSTFGRFKMSTAVNYANMRALNSLQIGSSHTHPSTSKGSSLFLTNISNLQVWLCVNIWLKKHSWLPLCNRRATFTGCYKTCTDLLNAISVYRI